MSRVGFADETRIGIAVENDAELLLRVRERANLRAAWSRVRANGLQSSSARTRREVGIFGSDEERNLSRLYRKLQQGKFEFEKAIGVPIRRPGKTPRPIVISAVQDRIVQRCILNVLQSIPALADYVKIETSFGGIEERSVRKAIQSIVSASQRDGYTYYARSDISNFFQGIPKDVVIGKIRTLIGDHPEFLRFVRSAMDVELRNIAELGAGARHFPSRSIGVVQGGCLSPLLGNILLHDFDMQLNGRGVVCFCYIDDFILMGKDKASITKAFHSARTMLSKYGLCVHEPKIGSSKASAGLIRDGFEFLGCRIVPGLISPNQKSRQRLLANIRSRFEQSKTYIQKCDQLNYARHDLSFSRTMFDVNNSLFSWGNQYSFCNDRISMAALQKDVNALVYDYLAFFRATIRTTEERRLFRALGMHLLLESKSAPILWAGVSPDTNQPGG